MWPQTWQYESLPVSFSHLISFLPSGNLRVISYQVQRDKQRNEKRMWRLRRHYFSVRLKLQPTITISLIDQIHIQGFWFCLTLSVHIQKWIYTQHKTRKPSSGNKVNINTKLQCAIRQQLEIRPDLNRVASDPGWF